MRSIGRLVSLLLGVLLALRAHADTTEINVLGWGQGDSFAYREVRHFTQHLNCGSDDCQPTPRPALEDYASLFLLSSGRSSLDALLVDVDELPCPNTEMDKLDAWVKEHKPKPGTPSRLAPDGTTQAEITLEGSGEWRGPAFHFRAKSKLGGGTPPSFGWVRMYVVAPSGQRVTSAMATLQFPSGTIEPLWAPDGRYVAWLFTPDQSRKPLEVELGATWGPSIQVLADAALSQVQVDGKDAEGYPTKFSVPQRVVEALWAKGFNAVGTGPAESVREKSVVYAAKGFETVAQQIAAAIPGGASIEPLTWKAPTDLIIGVGASAK